MALEATALLSESQAVNHEVVNSLASVRSLSELLVENPGLGDGDRTRFLTIIRKETDRLIRLLEHLKRPGDTVGPV